jgi:hypothetical protein
MELQPAPIPAKPRTAARPTLIAVLGKSALAALVVAGVTAGLAHLGHGPAPWPFAPSKDTTSQAEKQMRAEAFAAMAPLPLAIVPDRELDAAVRSMALPSAQARQLLTAARQDTAAAAPAPAPALASRPQAAPAPTARTARASGAPRPATASARPPRLAWLTLWDTDVQDGDVVRIDSQGYSRTVVLTKTPLTFAIPVPDSGVVTVTGIRDGDGGGITVGLSSGASTAVFPIMSVGQVLGLRTRMN